MRYEVMQQKQLSCANKKAPKSENLRAKEIGASGEQQIHFPAKYSQAPKTLYSIGLQSFIVPASSFTIPLKAPKIGGIIGELY